MFTNFDLNYILKLLGMLSEGALVSIKLFLLTLLFSIPLGLLIALGRMSRKVLINRPVEFYILIMRGTPLLLQIIFIYFAPFYMLPEGMGINLDRFTAVVIAFSLNYAAYFAEIFRGGIESISHGQSEAAAVLGFTKSQTFIRIVLPQVVKRILPPISNEVITLVKDTALVQIIGISELLRMAQNEASRIFSIMPVFAAGLFYLAITLVITKAFQLAEKKFSYYR